MGVKGKNDATFHVEVITLDERNNWEIRSLFDANELCNASYGMLMNQSDDHYFGVVTTHNKTSEIKHVSFYNLYMACRNNDKTCQHRPKMTLLSVYNQRMMNNLLFQRQKYTDQKTDEWFGPRVRKPLEKYVVLDKNPCSARKYSNQLKRVHVLPQFRDLSYCLYHLYINDSITMIPSKFIGLATRNTSHYIDYIGGRTNFDNCQLIIEPINSIQKFYLGCVCQSSKCMESRVFKKPEDFCPALGDQIDLLELKLNPFIGSLHRFSEWFKNST
uniref:Uncharacterized protein n=1 Tax=Panagrolaimus sp. JU765 TaxID=591449 RepID=A0AC34QEG7_9BILA